MLRLMCAFCFLPAIAWPAPGDRVGDFSKYQISINGQSGTMTDEIVAYDPYIDYYLVRDTIEVTGQAPDVHDSWLPTPDIYTPEQGQQEVSDCLKNSGTLEKFQLNGVTYDVCREYWNPNAYDIKGPFPIDGRAAFNNQNDANAIGELIEFHWADLI